MTRQGAIATGEPLASSSGDLAAFSWGTLVSSSGARHAPVIEWGCGVPGRGEDPCTPSEMSPSYTSTLSCKSGNLEG
eukprot:5853821-Prymnesium_polylepis.2